MSNSKKIKLNKEELEILETVEQNLGKISLQKISRTERQRLADIARNTTAKNKSITIRISEKDLLKTKAKAEFLGMPYQTWISSLIHQNL